VPTAADPDLTVTGIAQALYIKNEWEKERAFGIPLLDKIYTSPLTRALQTCNIAFGWLKKCQPKLPILVVEVSTKVVSVELFFETFDPQNCREQNGVYTYDRRGSRTYISNNFPEYHLEDGFSEEDTQWLCDIRETKTQMMARAQSVFDMIFNEEPPVTCEPALHIYHSDVLMAPPAGKAFA